MPLFKVVEIFPPKPAPEPAAPRKKSIPTETLAQPQEPKQAQPVKLQEQKQQDLQQPVKQPPEQKEQEQQQEQQDQKEQHSEEEQQSSSPDKGFTSSISFF